ncbi:hypothetical protein [Adhaeribacter aquaticus]|uniref:hypothetical protein n=1 Tax=Adhaeribacter aquaticus TaxID=299567 RepID=UPI0003FB2563|nr:hypothetical protein [Adhaeribacter aquaticus]
MDLDQLKVSIPEVREEKVKLERNIVKLLHEFYDKTGVLPDNITYKSELFYVEESSAPIDIRVEVNVELNIKINSNEGQQ